MRLFRSIFTLHGRNTKMQSSTAVTVRYESYIMPIWRLHARLSMCRPHLTNFLLRRCLPSRRPTNHIGSHNKHIYQPDSDISIRGYFFFLFSVNACRAKLATCLHHRTASRNSERNISSIAHLHYIFANFLLSCSFYT